jgi:putative flippase GtrA
VVGLLSASLDIGVLQSLMVLGLDYRLATSAGFVVGMLFNYLCHLHITFHSPFSMISALRYAIVVALNYLLTLGLVMVSVTLWLHPLPGKLVALPVVALVGFVAGRTWIFR